MDLQRLYEILRETTVQLRKGEIVETERVGPIEVTTVNTMMHVDHARQDLQVIDLELLAVGVDREAGEKYRSEFVQILESYPDLNELASGPSYITVGARIGDQGAAFQLFALGQVLGLWKVITPATIGASGGMARELAGVGFVMITGWRP
jgi:hypothetical protein